MNDDRFASHRIIFEGREFPTAALCLDHLGMHGNLPGISEEAAEWLWRFVICLGQSREDKSDRVIRCAVETLRLCHQHKDHLLRNFPEHFGGPIRPGFYADWIGSLECMIVVAKERPRCRWTAPLIPGDQNFGRPWPEVQAELRQHLEHAVAAAKRKPWWQFWR